MARFIGLITPFLTLTRESRIAKPLGTYVEIGRGQQARPLHMGAIIHTGDRFAMFCNTSIGNSAISPLFVSGIAATDHPDGKASLHHFHYHSGQLSDTNAVRG